MIILILLKKLKKIEKLDAYYEWVDTNGKDCNLYNLVRYGVKEMQEVTKKASQIA